MLFETLKVSDFLNFLHTTSSLLFIPIKVKFISAIPSTNICNTAEITWISFFSQRPSAIQRNRSERSNRKRRRASQKQLGKPNRIRRKAKRNRGLKKTTIWLPEVTSRYETSPILHWMKRWRLTMPSHSSSSEPVSRPFVLVTSDVTLEMLPHTAWTDCSTNILTSKFWQIGFILVRQTNVYFLHFSPAVFVVIVTIWGLTVA